MKVGDASNVRYRGTATPTRVDTKATPPLAIPFGPATKPQKAPSNGGIPAMQVLSGTLSKWTDMGVDGPMGASRVTPAVDFPGLEKVDRIALDGKTGIGALSLLSGGRIIIPGHQSFGGDYVVSARMDASGRLEYVNAQYSGAIDHGAVYETSRNRILTSIYGHIETAHIGDDGKLGELTRVEGVPATSHLAQLSPGVFIAAGSGEMVAFSIDDSGKATIGARVQTDFTYATSDAPAVYRGHIVVRASNDVRTYAQRGDTFERVDSKPCFNQTAQMPLSIGKNGVFAITNAAHDAIRTYRVDAAGRLTDGATISTDDGAKLSPIVFDDLIITKDNWCNVLSYRLDDNLKPTRVGKGAGNIVGRPTITRDGVVLTGDSMGNVSAFKLDAQGNFTKLPGFRDGHQALAPIAVTANGYVLACVDEDLVSLRRSTT